jgi:hypothetical protein
MGSISNPPSLNSSQALGENSRRGRRLEHARAHALPGMVIFGLCSGKGKTLG